MSLSEWCTFTSSIIKYCSDELGVYELADKEEITLYYGYGKIRTKLLEHLKMKDFPLVKYFRFEKLNSEEECALKEQELLRSYQEEFGILPLYNERESEKQA